MTTRKMEERELTGRKPRKPGLSEEAGWHSDKEQLVFCACRAAR